MSSAPLPPGPRGAAAAQTLLQLARDPLTAMPMLVQRYGDVVYVGTAGITFYLINHPDLVRELLVVHADDVRKPRSTSRPVADFTGSGLLVSDRALWQQQRRTIQPAFHARLVEGYAQEIVRCADVVMNDWQPGRVYDIEIEMMRMTLMMVTHTLFESDLDDARELMADIVHTLWEVSSFQGLLPFSVPRWLPVAGNAAKWRAIARLNTLIDRLLARAQSRSSATSLVTMLQSAGLDAQQQRDEIITVLLAGHESTANALTWTWHLLAQHSEARARLEDEIATVLGGRTPTADDVGLLPYTEMVVKEALRLYPPAWGLPRETITEFALDGYRIQRGAMVVVAPYVLHRDARLYPQPDAFLPERFADGAGDVSPFAYLPFGAGPRFCVGMPFALLALRLIVARVTQRFRLEATAETQVRLAPLLTLRPRDGLRLQVVSL
ncbi:MAG: cytochrome P450 [Chloroflexota bacterium]|nr:cytochrome P450 [Chloroflexota bacterium]